MSALIRREIEKVDRGTLLRASDQLTRRYKGGNFSAPAIRGEADRAAYMAVRLPATYAANWHVFSQIRRLDPQADVQTILDLGAGPGTAVWAAAEIFPELRQATLVESDPAWFELGQLIAAGSPHPHLGQARWIRQDLRENLDCQPHDVAIVSYSLGELPEPAAKALVRRGWELAAKFLVIVEPGDRRGFAVVHAARSSLIAESATILAPCPHNDACPMAAAGDWCHFAQRVARTSLHRQLKGGALSYEDEKFSYVVAARPHATPAPSRIVRHPQKHSGHVQLTLCTRRGLEFRTVSRSQQAYRHARQAEWGDSWAE